MGHHYPTPPTLPYTITPFHTLPYTALHYHTLSYTLSYTITHYHTLSHTIPHSYTLSHTFMCTLSYTILYYHTLSYTITHYHALSYVHYPTLSHTIIHYPSSYHLLPLSTATALANSLVFSKLDYCNSLYSGISQTNLNKLQRIQKFIGTCHYKYFKISTHHTNTQKNYTGSLSNKESTTKPVFSHTKHLQINNPHIFTIVFHSRHILFLHDLQIRLFFPFHMSDHHLAKGLSLSSVHASGIHSPLIPETHLLYQYSVPDSKHTSSKLRSLPRLFPISLDCLPGF